MLRTTYFEQIPLAALMKHLQEQTDQETNAPAEAMENTEKMEMDTAPVDGVQGQETRG